MDVDAFLSRWTAAPASERANSQPFLLELCAVLGVSKPAPGNTGSYCFERTVKRHNADGTTRSDGRIDLYKEGCFVLESKQKTEKERQNTKAFDTGMIAAKQQAEEYAKFLPEWPPFLVVVDVGHAIELYADFSGTGKRYLPFTNHKFFSGHRLQLQQLREPKVRELLAKMWTDARSLDPSLVSQRVTKLVAEKLAAISKSLEGAGHDAEAVASFLMRCIFTMFAEDVKLLPARSFTKKLEHWREQPQKFAGQLQMLWAEMNVGGESLAFDDRILKFNGGLFANTHAFALNATQIGWLHEAATQDWTEVEPAIFGTLLERALNPKERHALGAHFTPRAYVERLVFPTVIEPLREDWDRVKVAVMARLVRLDSLKSDEARKKLKEAARKELLAFHHTLCTTRVLDPACGTGNFLYVAMEHMKRLEGEVLDMLAQLEGTQRLALLSSSASDGTGPRETVDPHQFLGIEINGRAAIIAELVLWIGYLQWHYRTFLAGSGGGAQWHEPVLRQFGNIQHRDAILIWDGEPELIRDEHGKPITQWDGVSTKRHPVTGEDVPDESKTVLLYRYENPRKAAWPATEFVVGNPPFIGNKRMRASLGGGYVAALRAAWGDLPESIDFVMYWWAHGAELVGRGDVRRSGLITTNSITQAYGRPLVRRALEKGHIAMAIPDHPWTDEKSGAAVRISMTVVAHGEGVGVIGVAVSDDEPEVSFSLPGFIDDRLRMGATLSSAVGLQSNVGLTFMGVSLIGGGFLPDGEQRVRLAGELGNRLAGYATGSDLQRTNRGLKVIDTFGLQAGELMQQFPKTYAYLLDHVKPERVQNNRATYANYWWLHGESRPKMRRALSPLDRYIATCRTAKQRVFLFVEGTTIPESTVIAVAASDAALLAVLSSTVHVTWASSAGGRLGVGNDSRYNNTLCFDPFPFPTLTNTQRERLCVLGEALDSHRKAQQAKHPGLTITGMYNVLACLRSGEKLSDNEKLTHEQGLVGILKQLHDDIDAAVLDAYGWPKDLDDEGLLERVVALNHERAAEERRGLVRWLRPEYQVPLLQQSSPLAAEQVDIGNIHEDADDDDTDAVVTSPVPKKAKKLPWPDEWPERVAAVARALRGSGGATVEGLADGFSRAKTVDVEDILEALRDYGQVEQVDHEVFRAVG